MPAEATTALRPSEPPFDSLEILHRYEVLDDAATTHRALDVYHICALRRFRFFEHRYRWTGSGIEREPRVLPSDDDEHSSDYRLHGPLLRTGANRLFLVDLARDVTPGELVTVAFEQDLIDHHETFEPRLRKTVRSTMEKLILEVSLPPALRVNVRAVVYELVTDQVSSPPVALSPVPTDSGTFQYSVASPLVGSQYAIEWT